jgi:plastocyanin
MKRLCLLSVIAVAALVGCSSDNGTTNAEASTAEQPNEEAPFELNDAPVETNEVGAVKSYRFDPTVIEVGVGDEVTWANEDDFPHNVHFLTGSDETHDLPIADSVSVSFDEAGDYYYECSLHPQQMRGKVIVTQ